MIHHEMDLRIPDHIAGAQNVGGLLRGLQRDVFSAINTVLSAWERGSD
jgi:hypothetical protein